MPGLSMMKEIMIKNHDENPIHDKPEGNNLRKFANLVSNSSELDEVKEKKESYRTCR